MENEQTNDRGIRCRRCGGRKFRVVYTRRAYGAKVIRRRECQTCSQRLTTWERAIGGPS
jgi:transcriptional regulator NrdR family protein